LVESKIAKTARFATIFANFVQKHANFCSFLIEQPFGCAEAVLDGFAKLHM